jgi:hypothetical protein
MNLQYGLGNLQRLLQVMPEHTAQGYMLPIPSRQVGKTDARLMQDLVRP